MYCTGWSKSCWTAFEVNLTKEYYQNIEEYNKKHILKEALVNILRKNTGISNKTLHQSRKLKLSKISEEPISCVSLIFKNDPYFIRFKFLEFFVWNILKRKACCKLHKKCETFFKNLKSTWEQVRMNYIISMKSLHRRFAGCSQSKK